MSKFDSEQHNGHDNLHLWYLRESDEYRIAVANYLALMDELGMEFLHHKMKWLTENEHFLDGDNFGKPEPVALRLERITMAPPDKEEA